jgi:hypothetical protein
MEFYLPADSYYKELDKKNFIEYHDLNKDFYQRKLSLSNEAEVPAC